jgi:small-conductance mechanosensitive channel
MNSIGKEISAILSIPWVGAAGKSLLVIVVGFVAFKVVSVLAKHSSKKSSLKTIVLKPFLKIVRLLIAVAVVIAILSIFGITFEGVWSFLTTVLALVAIGFIAVWSVLSNFVCAMLIVSLKPFQIGDRVSFPGESVEGKVVDLSFVFTTLKRSDGSLLKIPNNLFFQKTIACFRTEQVNRTLAEQLRATEPFDESEEVSLK